MRACSYRNLNLNHSAQASAGVVPELIYWPSHHIATETSLLTQLPRSLEYLPSVDDIHAPSLEVVNRSCPAGTLPHGMKIGIIIVASFPVLISCVAIPSELFSSLISQKILVTFQSLPTPILYPHVTDSMGKWINHSINWWTAGFLPASSYLLLARQKMCNSTQSFNTSGGDWLTLGRSSSGPLANLNATHGIGHDIGFISFPFIEELVVCVSFLAHMHGKLNCDLQKS
jgi:hypothetical protein